MCWIWWTATDCWMVQGEWYRGSDDVNIFFICCFWKRCCDTLSEAICPFMKGVVWGSSCSIWWQNTNLKNFIRKNSEVRFTYYFYWLWSFKVYEWCSCKCLESQISYILFLMPSLLFFLLLRCQMYLYANPVTYPIGCAHELVCELCFFHWLWFVSSNTKILLFSRLPEKIGGKLPGVHYIRDVADADSLVSSLVRSVD